MAKLWDGTLQSNRLSEEELRQRNLLFESAKSGDWLEVYQILKSHRNLINVVEPDDPSLNTLLHYAAQEPKNESIIDSLLTVGAFRNVKNASGLTPHDYGKEHSYAKLEPLNLIGVSKEFLQQVDDEFFSLFFDGLHLSDQSPIRMPQLEVLLELTLPSIQFFITGYSYSAKYWLHKQSDSDIRLYLQTRSSIVSGSEQTHIITPEGSKPID